jgi:hypothetical protein
VTARGDALMSPNGVDESNRRALVDVVATPTANCVVWHAESFAVFVARVMNVTISP